MNAKLGRLGTWFSLLALAAVAACAQGEPAVPAIGVEAPAIMVQPTCGNGTPDMGEICDCKPGVSTQCLVEGKTCDMIMNGATGPLLCDAKTCQFNLSMCAVAGGPAAGGAGH
jgi:hypothetical protein